MKKAFLAAALGLVLSACGGGGGGGGPSFKDPDQAQFTYGTPAIPSIDEQPTVDAGSTGVSGALGIAGASDSQAAQDAVLSLAMLTNDMGDVFPGDVPAPYAQAADGASAASILAANRMARSYLGTAAVTAPGWDNPECWTLTAGQATFDHCRVTESDATSTMTLVLNGSLQREDGHLVWDLTISVNGSGTDNGSPVSMSFSDRLRGDIVWTDSTFAGYSRSDIWLSMHSSSLSASGAVTYNADYDLTYTVDPAFCLTGGTVTLKRLWGEVPQVDNASPDEFTDASVRITWVPGDPGTCSSEVNVAWGTPN